MIIAFTGAGISRDSGIPTFDENPELRDSLDRTYARLHPDKFSEVMKTLRDTCEAAKPNSAHIKLAELGIPTITMNIDGLHGRAIQSVDGDPSTLLEIHGSVFENNVVLYGDRAPQYATANDWIRKLRRGDILLVVGTSYYTTISTMLVALARSMGVQVFEVNSDAEHQVPDFLERHQSQIESMETFRQREIMF